MNTPTPLAGPWVPFGNEWVRRYSYADGAGYVGPGDWVAWRSNAEGGEVIAQGRWVLADGEGHAMALVDAALQREGRLTPAVDVAELQAALAKALEDGARWARLAEMACERPPPDCDCPGCSEARRTGGV